MAGTAATAATSTTTRSRTEAAVAAHPTNNWIASWAAAEQYPRKPFGDSANWSLDGFDNHSVRQVVRVSRGGSQLRIELSNVYGTQPLAVLGATIGRTGSGASVAPGSLRPLRFDHRFSTIIPAGSVITSDALSFDTEALESLTVTLYLKSRTGPATYHDGALATSYRATGDRRFDRTGSGFTETSLSWYYLTGVHVRGGGRDDGAVVAFGDSLTDGWGSSPNTNNRYPDELAEMLAARGTPTAVANLGINGNKLRVDSPCFGERGPSRFREQVLRQPGARTVIVSLGLNDIGTAGWPTGTCGDNPPVTADQIIDGHLDLIRVAVQHGLRVIGATLTPTRGSGYYTPEREQIRDAVNRWIKSSGAYDTVVDFERVLADPSDQDAMSPVLDSGDHLHPNDAGRRALAAAVLEALH